MEKYGIGSLDLNQMTKKYKNQWTEMYIETKIEKT